MSRIILVGIMFALSGCGAIDRFGAYLTGNASETCMSGVLYYQFTSGAAVAYDVNGNVMKCN